MDDKSHMLEVRYTAAVNFWIHQEEERWSILYNFLVASTIMLLAWTTIYSATTGHWLMLSLLSIAGIVQSVGWMAMMHRAAAFIERFGTFGGEVEKELFASDPGAPTFRGPFESGQEVRTRLKGSNFFGFVTSKRFSIGVPILFLIVFVALLIASAMRY